MHSSGHEGSQQTGTLRCSSNSVRFADTCREALLEEAVAAPEVTGRCTLTAGTGRWYSWYDDTTVTGARALDIDHLVPLAEAYDSGASTWSPERREAYANDLGDPRALVAVTARSNRQKPTRTSPSGCRPRTPCAATSRSGPR
jgi:hypothetical protein